MLTIIVNGEKKSINTSMTIAHLLDSMGIDVNKNKIAVELNHTICPKSQHAYTQVYDHDKIEIITAVGGG